MKSYQNLVLLQNLYRLKAIGYEYIEHFSVNDKATYETPNDLSTLVQNIATCHLCDLSKSRSQSMSGYGSQNAKLMIVDYSVTQIQDTNNKYFSGRSGETLQSMIENVVGLNIDDIYMTHIVKCKTLKSNKPSPSECNSCKSYLFAQIEFIKPNVIVTLGNEAYTQLTGDEGSDVNFESVRGHVIDFKEYKLIPIYHPQHLLRNPDLKRVTMNDLKTIKSCI